MRHFFTLSVIALAALLGACSSNPTTPATTGEIYGEAKIYNEYRVLLTDRSGLTVQLLDQGNVKQTIVTAADGIFSFKNVAAGVYDIRFYKEGYVWMDGTTDSLVAKNIQFVGNGRFFIDEYNHGYRNFEFYSILEPDSTFWAIKPDIRYEIIKNITPIDNIWVADTGTGHNMKSVYTNGTSETWKIRFIVDFEHTLPNTQSPRSLGFNMHFQPNNETKQNNSNINGNLLTWEYEYSSTNKLVKDTFGKIIRNNGSKGSKSIINAESIKVQAVSGIPNSYISNNIPSTRIAKTNELTVNLVE